MSSTQQTSAHAGRNRIILIAFVLLFATAVSVCGHLSTVAAGPMGGLVADPPNTSSNSYKVLAPIQSGNLTLFPVVRASRNTPSAGNFLTLDEGLRSGEVEVTEAGRVAGLVRPRGNTRPARSQGDQVNTLVLVNHGKRPLLLLAGEIVTGGKQDRIVAKDRIVPAGGDPIDLFVFCVEHGRWTESSVSFEVTNKEAAKTFMVQPTVRQQAMVTKSQQEVWDAVGGAVAGMAVAAAPPLASPSQTRTGQANRADLGTTSYAKAMNNRSVAEIVDKAEAPLLQANSQILESLKKENAVGVIVAVHGEIIWADLFADNSLLTRYWLKLVRSYAAEGLGSGPMHKAATIADAQRFLDQPSTGTTETSEGETGIYRYREVKTANTDMFTLESLLPGTGYDVHLSKLRIQGAPVKPINSRPVVLY